MHGTLPDIRNCTKLQALLLKGNELSGTLSTIGDQLRFFDLSSNRKFSGTIPQGIHKTKTTMLNNMKLSGTLPPAPLMRRHEDGSSVHAGIQTLSVMRNSIEGSLDNLENYATIQSLMLSGNLLSCKAPVLNKLSSLGIGSFVEPSRDALLYVGQHFMSTGLMKENMYRLLNKSHDSAVFVYAGNMGLHLHGSWIPPVEPGHLDKAEYLKNGMRNIMPGKCAFICINNSPPENCTNIRGLRD